MRMSPFGGKEREISIISIILIIIFSNGFLFYFQNISERDLRDSLFEQQKQRQIESTKEVSQHIGSDLSLGLGLTSSTSAGGSQSSCSSASADHTGSLSISTSQKSRSQ
jgi:hypothetical protein